MAWREFSAEYANLFKLLIGAIALALAVACLFKYRNIQRLKVEIAQLESRLSQGQELSKSFPSLSPSQKRDLQTSRERLFRVLPKEKDVPVLFQDIARLAQNHYLVDISFKVDDGVGAPGAPPAGAQARQPGASRGQAPAPAAAQESKPIQPVPVKVTFAGDYRDVAFFLDGLNKIPRLLTVQSVKMQRGFPLLSAEVMVHAYYQKGELPVAVTK